MRLLRSSFLLAVLVLTILAVAAPAASAVEVSSEPGATHCAAVTNVNHEVQGGCLVHLSGTFIIYMTTMSGEAPVAACNIEANARFDEAGHGYVFFQVISEADPGCNVTACDEPSPSHAQRPWEIRLLTTTTLRVNLCTRSDVAAEGQNGPLCQVIFAVQTDGTHDYELDANQRVCADPQVPFEVDSIVHIEETPIEILP
jgi:hypothetical protein